MANYYDKYLQAAGIGVPYKDLTKSQIEEKNKGNPLSGYGFMSAQEKQKRQLEMAMYEREMKRQDDAMQQQLIARMSSQGQIGYQSGAGLLGLLDHFRKGKQAPEAPAQDDPEVARYRELVHQLGPEQGLASLGSELQNPQMVADAQKALMDKQKATLENQKLQGEVDAQGKPYKVGQIIPNIPVTDSQGRPAKASYKVAGYDEEGMPKLELFKEGLNALIQDTNEGFATNPAGLNQRTLSFEKLMASTADGLDSYDRLKKVVTKNPEALSWSGGWVALADNAVHGVKNLANTLVDNNWQGDNSSKSVGDYGSLR